MPRGENKGLTAVLPLYFWCTAIRSAERLWQHQICGPAGEVQVWWWALPDSNRGPRDYESPALTAVLRAQLVTLQWFEASPLRLWDRRIRSAVRSDDFTHCSEPLAAIHDWPFSLGRKFVATLPLRKCHGLLILDMVCCGHGKM